MPNDRKTELTRLFRIAGASNPEGWAGSEAEEDIPQLARFLFLRQAWRGVLDEEDGNWVGDHVEASRRRPGSPGSGTGSALQRLLAAGADPYDLAHLVRGMQWELLHHICYLLEDPCIDEPELAHVAWRLFEVDEDEQPLRPVGGLHESVLETDPTGREMRPKVT